MKILHRYLLRTMLRNLFMSLLVFALLFMVFDFFDRIDNILPEDAEVLLVAQYFIYKIPLTISLMLPVAMLVATMFTVGLLSRNSEMTAMRSSGVTVFWLARPLFLVGIGASFVALLLNQTLVPYTQRRVKEIYNIDIMRKQARGNLSHADFWWRRGNQFYSVGTFDSRTNELHEFTQLTIDRDFNIVKRVGAGAVQWIDGMLGWNMKGVDEYRFEPPAPRPAASSSIAQLPLPIPEKPEDFYSVKPEPETMSYGSYRRYIRRQLENGVNVAPLLPDLYEKLSFPLVNLMIVIVVIPFALLPARSGKMATAFLSGLLIGFSYYAVHSFSLALGRGDFWPPMLSAWMANIVLAMVGTALMLGTEAPR